MTTEKRTAAHGSVLVIFSEDQVLYDGKNYTVRNPLTKVYGELAKELQVVVSGPTKRAADADREGYSDYKIVYSSRPYYGGAALGFFKSLPRIAIPTLRNIKACLREVDLAMIRLPSPIGFIVYRQARRAGKPCFLYVAGDIRRVATQGEKYRNSVMRLAVAVAAGAFHRLTRRMARGSLVFVTGSELHREFSPLAARCVNLVPSVVSERDVFYREDTCTGQPIRLLYVGRLVPVKGIKYLFQSLKNLLERGLPVELQLVGEGYQRPQLESLAEQLGVIEHVKFLGRVPFGPELFRVYREADIFVLPSLSEGIPKTLLEAMASGLPIVATRVGGVPDVIRHDETGLLVEPRSPEGLAEAVERIIHDHDLRRRLIQNRYAFVCEHTVEKQAARMWREIRDFFGLEGR